MFGRNPGLPANATSPLVLPNAIVSAKAACLLVSIAAILAASAAAISAAVNSAAVISAVVAAVAAVEVPPVAYAKAIAANISLLSVTTSIVSSTTSPAASKILLIILIRQICYLKVLHT